MNDWVAHRTRLAGQEYSDATLGSLDLRNARAAASRWTNCTFDSTRLSSADFRGAVFENCTFKRVDFQHSVLACRISNCHFDHCNFDQALFAGAWLSGTTITRSRAQMSEWPDCSIYDSKIDCDFRHAKIGIAIGERIDWRGSNFWAAQVPLNCAMASGNQFDARQIGAFFALLQTAKLPTEMAEWLEAATPEKSKRLVERILRPTTGGSATMAEA